MKIILVAVDGSPRAPHVFDTAAELASKLGAELHLMQALTIPPEFPAAAAGSAADTLPGIPDEGRRFAAHRAIEARSKPRAYAPTVVVGQAWRVILETAAALNVDLIVVGSHGYHGWDRVLGTTAGKVANLVERNVLVVHEREARTP